MQAAKIFLERSFPGLLYINTHVIMRILQIWFKLLTSLKSDPILCVKKSCSEHQILFTREALGKRIWSVYTLSE